MGVLADKDYAAMIEAVAPLADVVVCYTPDNPRALAAADLAAAVRATASALAAPAPVAVAPTSAAVSAPAAPAPVLASSPVIEAVPDAAAALRRGRSAAGTDGIVVAFGTLYAIADLKRAL